jgi:hypothetical protein
LSKEHEALLGEHPITESSSSLGSGERDKRAKNSLLTEESGRRTGGDDDPSLVLLEQDRDGDDGNLISTKGGGGGGGYGEYRVVDLKGLLRARSLKVSGKKAELVARLRAYDGSHDREAY